MANSDEPAKLFPIFQKNFRPKGPDPLQEIQLTLEKSQIERQQAKRRKCLLGKRETPGLVQMVLDAGQKTIGPVYCEECGLLYSPGDIEDEREHLKAHSRLENRFSLRLWKNANIVLEFPLEACSIVFIERKAVNKRNLASLKELLLWLDSELGAAYDTVDRDAERVFLYMFRTKRKNVHQVLGCAIVETLHKDKILTSRLGTTSSSVDTEVQRNKPLLLGLTRLWTDSAFRRKHIATRLCDAVRTNSGIPGFVVPKAQLGILEPSEDGRNFMTKYTSGCGSSYTYAV